MTETERVREAFVQLWGRMGPFWGVAPTTARVYGWLLSRADGAAADEIVEGLSMSRGAVSMACRELRDWGLIHGERARARGNPPTARRPISKSRSATSCRRASGASGIRSSSTCGRGSRRLEAERSRRRGRFRERLKSIEALVGLADSMAESFLRGGSCRASD